MLDTSNFPHIYSFIIRVQKNFIVCKNLDWSALFMRLKLTAPRAVVNGVQGTADLKVPITKKCI